MAQVLAADIAADVRENLQPGTWKEFLDALAEALTDPPNE